MENNSETSRYCGQIVLRVPVFLKKTLVKLIIISPILEQKKVQEVLSSTFKKIIRGIKCFVKSG